MRDRGRERDRDRERQRERQRGRGAERERDRETERERQRESETETERGRDRVMQSGAYISPLATSASFPASGLVVHSWLLILSLTFNPCPPPRLGAERSLSSFP